MAAASFYSAAQASRSAVEGQHDKLQPEQLQLLRRGRRQGAPNPQAMRFGQVHQCSAPAARGREPAGRSPTAPVVAAAPPELRGLIIFTRILRRFFFVNDLYNMDPDTDRLFYAQHILNSGFNDVLYLLRSLGYIYIRE